MTNLSSPHWHRLTQDEKAALLNSHDGAIPEQAMIDAAKSIPLQITTADLTTKINSLTVAIRSAQLDLEIAEMEGDKSWADQHRKTIATFEARRNLLRDRLAEEVPVVSKQDAIPGMAHFAGTGPAFTRCDACSFAEGHGRMEGAKGMGALKPITCAKWREMMRERAGKGQPSFRHTTKSCKHFWKRPILLSEET